MIDYHILEIVDIFSDLDENQLGLIFDVCIEKTCSLGTVIVREHTATTEMYIVLDGEVEITVKEAAGLDHEVHLATLRSGQSFGEVNLVDEGLRMATVRCITENCRLLEISRTDLLRVLKENPDVGFKVLYNLSADLCLKMRQATYRVY
jgi:CRP-like cAMP-binding protein